jgi:hypothetical protein
MTTASISKAQAKKILDFCQTHSLEKFFFAKDQGAYFGATVGKNEDKTFKNCIEYINGMEPDKKNKDGSDWYDNARMKFGGDDFGIHIPVSWLTLFFQKKEFVNKRRFSIKITANNVQLVE